ncbi:MAG: tRNA (N6-isopentenyl adenosine(37)-C2)-methylthiotransferase MiaB [Lachnospiraceae bacterium]|nr:tRNA (N6-isopentenyl adenosine(37)-C2)-methylthiotransferase MiaB [Lachnospiraceae bacterium]
MYNIDIPELEPDRQYYFMNRCKELIYEKQVELNRPLTYCVTTFGCQMNAHDSEKLKGILEAIGYEEVDDESADFVIYNTCTVRENANQKLYGHLGLLKNYKKTKNPNMIIALCGCMMQETHVVETIRTKYPFVNIVFGTHNIYKLAELIYNNLTGEKRVIEILEKSTQTVEALPQKRKYSFKSGVNIMYGCNNFCSYCIVPYVRGREKSRKPEDILTEIRELARRGVKEVMLLGQNVNSYGKIYDYSDGKIVPMPEGDSITFPALLKKVCEIDGIERIRFMTSHPKDLSDELIKVMASEPKICKHLHLPVQSGSTDILAKMNRRYTKEGYLSLVDKIRQAMPDISLTTDIIVGFPGETEEDFLDTLDIVSKVKYDQAFTFIYSKRTGTPAASEVNQVPEDVVKDRFNRLLTLVNTISNERINRYSGQTKDILVEEINHQDSNLLTGRTEENITVHFEGDSSLIGDIIKVKLIECRGFYYIGERI